MGRTTLLKGFGKFRMAALPEVLSDRFWLLVRVNERKCAADRALYFACVQTARTRRAWSCRFSIGWLSDLVDSGQ
jgi:hypothetical protein